MNNFFFGSFGKGVGNNYGLLYNRFVVIDARYIHTSFAHIPTSTNINNLITAIGGAEYGNKLQYIGTNEFGFNAKSSGKRLTTGEYSGFLDYLAFFTGSSNNTTYINSQVTVGVEDDNVGRSIRLIIDTPIEINGNSAIYVGNDGRRYNCVLIGSTWWLAENLAETKYRNGDPITKVTDSVSWTELTTAAYCYPNGNYLNYSIELNLDIKIFLSSIFNSVSGIMNVGANHPYIPLTQPYNTAPWNYSGTETVSDIPVDVVDWVLVELRKAYTPLQAASSIPVGRCVGLLKSNGHIVGLDGSSALIMQVSGIGENLYPVIYHRHSLAIMGNSGISLSNGVYSYDFTTGLDKVYGGIDACNYLGGIVVKMASGDINQDGIINSSDSQLVENNTSLTNGYFIYDLDMDGNVYLSDKTKLTPNLNKFNTITNY